MKRLAFLVALLASSAAWADPVTLLSAATAISNPATPPIVAKLSNADSTVIRPLPAQAFQAVETGTGAISATVQVQVSMDGTNWSTYGPPITLSGTTTANNSAYAYAPFDYVGAIVTAISGTGATVTLKMDAAP